MFPTVGKLTKLNDVSDAHAKAGHKHPCSEPQEVEFRRPPRVGEQWVFGVNGRECTTSHVKKVEVSIGVRYPPLDPLGLATVDMAPPPRDSTVIFETSNSKYKLFLSGVDILSQGV